MCLTNNDKGIWMVLFYVGSKIFSLIILKLPILNFLDTSQKVTNDDCTGHHW